MKFWKPGLVNRTLNRHRYRWREFALAVAALLMSAGTLDSKWASQNDLDHPVSDLSFHEILCDTRPEILRDWDCAAGVECHDGDRLLYSQMHDAVFHSTIRKLYGGVSGLEHPQFKA